MLTGKRQNLSNMSVFGSECYVYKQDKSKFDPRCTKGIFFGYNKGSPAYLVYFPETGKIMKCRVVKFVKPAQNASGQHVHTDYLSQEKDDDRNFVQHKSNPAGNGNADGTADDLNETAGGSGSGADGQKDVKSIGEKASYPRRERKPPAYLSDYVAKGDFEDDDQVMSSIDYCYKVHTLPQNYKEAIESPESEHWRNAMEEEMNSLKENNTFTLTPCQRAEN